MNTQYFDFVPNWKQLLNRVYIKKNYQKSIFVLIFSGFYDFF